MRDGWRESGSVDGIKNSSFNSMTGACAPNRAGLPRWDFFAALALLRLKKARARAFRRTF
jgi:hypothetical protein